MMTQYIQRDLTNVYFANISYWKAYIPNWRGFHFGITEVKVDGVLAVSVRFMENILKVMMRCIQKTYTNA